MILITNYHTHTARCGHARGKEREYVEAAIAAGIKVLGFADHVPTPPFEPEISQFRMPFSQAGEYAAEINRLKEEYKDDIELHIGFECEYIPMIFEKQTRMLADIGCEYLILGQHFNVVQGTDYVFRNLDPTDDIFFLKNYVDIIEEGVMTGRFSYICHPDAFTFTGDREIFDCAMERICVAAKKADIPLEFNMQSFRGGNGKMPSNIFESAKKIGNKVIIGYDAHNPWLLDEPEWLKRCIDCIDGIGLERLERLELRPIV